MTALRNYTQNHLLSREHSTHSSTTTTSPISPSPTSNSFAPVLSHSVSHQSIIPSSRTRGRTATVGATSSTTDLDRSTASHRFTLVPAQAHPLDQSSRPASDAAEQISIPPFTRSQSQNDAESPASAVTTSQLDSSIPRRSMTRSRSATTGTVMAASSTNNTHNTADNATSSGSLPSIRFSVFLDPRSQRPSLHFSPIARTLPTGNEIIRVGRYSERDSQPTVPMNVPSAAPVGFKSKVVSRRHCEFWYEGGKWYIKDVKSSSGTFLNHIRLSPPGQESKPFPVNDGDTVQLGIDFKGGEEMIFRCVKMRLELNRGWQNKLNKFKYVQAYQRLFMEAVPLHPTKACAN